MMIEGEQTDCEHDVDDSGQPDDQFRPCGAHETCSYDSSVVQLSTRLFCKEVSVNSSLDRFAPGYFQAWMEFERSICLYVPGNVTQGLYNTNRTRLHRMPWDHDSLVMPVPGHEGNQDVDVSLDTCRALCDRTLRCNYIAHVPIVPNVNRRPGCYMFEREITADTENFSVPMEPALGIAYGQVHLSQATFQKRSCPTSDAVDDDDDGSYANASKSREKRRATISQPRGK